MTMRVALITGAGTGIGRATALRFLRDGVAVVGVGRRPEPLAELQRLAGENANRVAVLAADVTADDTPKQAVQAAISAFGRLDYLINNAGAGSPRPLHESDDAFIDESLDLMLRAPIRLTREALTVMGSGAAIVNVSSTFGLIGGMRAGTYAAVKAGIIGLTRHLAAQYGSQGIRSNAVAPGVIATEMTAGRLDNERVRRMNQEMTPAEGWGQPEDVASAIGFLCSRDARWINGQVLAVDGGWSTTKFLTEDALAADRAPSPITV
jgi:meso-butanediol dehydrogenase/(S,S)-butanediol dehydrogenase/diacetyl reductase